MPVVICAHCQEPETGRRKLNRFCGQCQRDTHRTCLNECPSFKAKAEEIKGGEPQPGQMVTIYQDPLTQAKREGRARLVSCENDDSGVYDGRMLQQWLVRFEGESEVYTRFILTNAPYAGPDGPDRKGPEPRGGSQ